MAKFTKAAMLKTLRETKKARKFYEHACPPYGELVSVKFEGKNIITEGPSGASYMSKIVDWKATQSLDMPFLLNTHTKARLYPIFGSAEA